ncbi:HAMP domain-containing protein [Phytoactinopolyspora sp. XMNu-373]|uniref:histidine kinase n=1 Tax=Phytoactinopolyspora mesophila TaxID=2650750 RepID=A0A7K3M9C7_9ACTN|nr:HAMP domain-containing protein [Phytoactinopolyspora mesophila]
MRRRLLFAYLLMLAAVLVAVAVPYATSTATRDTQAVFIDQLNDTARFASLAEPALRSGETVMLAAELTRYDELYTVGAAVLDINREVITASREELPLSDDAVQTKIDAGLSGERSGIDQVVWPWEREPLVLVEPVGRGGEVIGVALTVADTEELRAQILRQWSLLATIAVVALGLATLAAVGLARWTLRPVHDLDSVAHDISAGTLDARVPEDEGPAELRRLASSFNTMADTVTGALTRQRAFVSHASHQLRTPLGVLRLRLENLVDHLRPSGEREHRLAMAETARLAGILSGLLALARAEGTELDLAAVDLDAVVQERVTAWEPMTATHNVRLLRAGGADALVLAAPEALEQVLDALIDNALKFGSPDGEITIGTALSDDGRAEIHVTDDGPGLDEEERAHATERFWRSPAHQNTPGSGLGLAIVHELISACGGDLALLHAEPHGLDARIRLRISPTGPPGNTESPLHAALPDTSRRPPEGSADGPPDAPVPVRPGR